jgi:hypothetical protein
MWRLSLNGGRWDCVSWTSVGPSAGASGAGADIGATLAKPGKPGLAGRVLETAANKKVPLNNYWKGQVAAAKAARKAAAGAAAGFGAVQGLKQADKALRNKSRDPNNNGKPPCP